MSAAPTVTVISREGCQPCIATHRRLAKLNIGYDTVDASDETAIAQARSLGRLELPVVIVTDETGVIDSWAGFSPDRLAALAASHTPKKEHRMSENNTPEATDATRTITVDGMQIELIGRESILDRGEAGLRAGWEADKAARQADEPEEDEDAYQARLDAEDREAELRDEALDTLIELIEEVAVGYEVNRSEDHAGKEIAYVYDPDAPDFNAQVDLESESGKPLTPEALRRSLPVELMGVQDLAWEIEHAFDDDETDYTEDRPPFGSDHNSFWASQRYYFGQEAVLARHNSLEARLAQISAE